MGNGASNMSATDITPAINFMVTFATAANLRVEVPHTVFNFSKK
jgi:hypothetical protein